MALSLCLLPVCYCQPEFFTFLVILGHLGIIIKQWTYFRNYFGVSSRYNLKLLLNKIKFRAKCSSVVYVLHLGPVSTCDGWMID